APAARLRARPRARPRHPRPRRGDGERRPGDRVVDPGRAREAPRGADGAGHRPPPVDDRERRPHHRAAQGRGARGGHARAAPRAWRRVRPPAPHAVRRPGLDAPPRGRARVRWPRRAVVLGALLAGCGVVGGAGYLVHAGWSEARILWRRQPIAALLARPDLDPALRERLELVLSVRKFA